MELDPVLHRFLPTLQGPAWMAKWVEVLPGVADSEIVYVTPEMDRLYGYTWPDTLLGRHISSVHLFDEALITRQYAVLRFWGFEAPRHYVMHGLHPNGRTVRVVKHVMQQTVDTQTVWVTHHEPWHRRTPYPRLRAPEPPDLTRQAVRAFLGETSLAEAQRLVQLLRDPTYATTLRAWLRVPDAAVSAERLTPPDEPLSAQAHLVPGELGERLRQARKGHGLTQRQMAAQLRRQGQALTPQHLSNLERGRRQPSLGLVVALAQELGCPLSTLLGHEAPRAPTAGHSRPSLAPLRRPGEERIWETDAVGVPETERRPLIDDTLVGQSPAMHGVTTLVHQVAATPATVLLLGESGVGKEQIARAIHAQSLRQGYAFIAVNCATLTTSLAASALFGHERGAFTGAVAQQHGLFERAHRGTLFLDEVGSLPLEVQAMLLRVLQERTFERVGGTRPLRVDVRVIAATNQPLDQMVTQGTFRADLFYRLNVIPLHVPPLRERVEDIPLLVAHFLQQASHAMQRPAPRITTDALEALQRYPWPGNVRELEHCMTRLVVTGPPDLLHLAELPPEIRRIPHRSTPYP